MDITIRQLEIFRAVVIAGSISKAARILGLSQPSMSQQLARLEEVLDVQLVHRHRSGRVTLTADGEHWFRHSEDIVGRMERIKTEHELRVGQSRAVLRLGTTPALRGRFTSAAARIGLENPDFMKFELHYEATSADLAQQLRLHRVNMAILAQSAIAADASSFAISKLFDDAIAWVVPSGISDDEIRRALAPDADAGRCHPVLRRHVEVEGAASTRMASADWYRSHLPLSVPVLTAPTFATCVEFVAEGLATGHMLLSLWPNLSASVRARLRVFEIPGMQRPVVLAMQKHLLSHQGFARVFTDLTGLCRTEYKSEMDEASVRSFTEFVAEPGPGGARAEGTAGS